MEARITFAQAIRELREARGGSMEGDGAIVLGCCPNDAIYLQ
jgi:hypothetical protein